MNNNNDIQPLASELLAELKATNKRYFVMLITVMLLWFATVGVFVWYISLPVEETEIEQEVDDSNYNQIIGGDYIGGETKNN